MVEVARGGSSSHLLPMLLLAPHGWGSSSYAILGERVCASLCACARVRTVRLACAVCGTCDDICDSRTAPRTATAPLAYGCQRTPSWGSNTGQVLETSSSLACWSHTPASGTFPSACTGPAGTACPRLQRTAQDSWRRMPRCTLMWAARRGRCALCSWGPPPPLLLLLRLAACVHVGVRARARGHQHQPLASTHPQTLFPRSQPNTHRAPPCSLR